MTERLTLVVDNDLDRFSPEWRRGFAKGRLIGRLHAAIDCQRDGDTDAADHHFEKATRIR